MKSIVFHCYAAFTVLLISVTASAQCTSPLRDAGFELQRDKRVRSPWTPEGFAGIDLNMNLSQQGANNAFMRATRGWNAIRQRLTLEAGYLYTLTVYVRTSNNVKDAYLGFRNRSQQVLNEVKFGPLHGYTRLQIKFRPAQSDQYNVFVGFHAMNQDAWMQVDNFSITFPCRDTQQIPADH